MTSNPIFINDAKAIDPPTHYGPHSGLYRYDRPCHYLVVYRVLLQKLISQGLTKRWTGEYHTGECGIFKSEGGCAIKGVGELVLGPRACYFDGGLSRDYEHRRKALLDEAAALITALVLGFDPMNPIESLLELTATTLVLDPKELGVALTSSFNGGPFGGNALDCFFDPIKPYGDLRDYRRYVMITHEGKTAAWVDQLYADQDLAAAYKEKLNTRLADQRINVIACSADRSAKNGLRFWINTGRITSIDGWRTAEEIDAVLAGGEVTGRGR